MARGYDTVIKTLYKRNGLIHIESLVALDDPMLLKDELLRYEADPGNFIGMPHTKRILEKISRH